MKKTKLHPKWIACILLAIAGLLCAFVFTPIRFSGYLLLGSAALIPIFHLLRNRKWPRRILAGLLAVLVIAMAVTGCLIASACGGRGEPEADYLIVLGTKVNGTQPSLMLRQRLDAAVEYLNTYPDATAVVTGGMGNDESISEAECMYNYLTGAGIDPDRIWMEDQATNTVENLRNTLTLIDLRTGQAPEHVTILSNEFHLYRAGLMARDLGLDASLIPAKSENFLLFANYFLRDIFAVWKYIILGG